MDNQTALLSAQARPKTITKLVTVLQPENVCSQLQFVSTGALPDRFTFISIVEHLASQWNYRKSSGGYQKPPITSGAVVHTEASQQEVSWQLLVEVEVVWSLHDLPVSVRVSGHLLNFIWDWLQPPPPHDPGKDKGLWKMDWMDELLFFLVV